MRTLFVFTLFLFFIGTSVSAQDCLDAKLEKTSPDKARYHRRLVRVNDTLFFAEVFDLKERLRFTGNYIFKEGKLKEQGEFVFYYPNGEVESRGMYHDGFKVGNWERFAENGAQRPDKYYQPTRSKELNAILKEDE